MAKQKSYSEKRDFKKTSEPKGEKRKPSEGDPLFVIQKHDATNLHYDFRLEIGGKLKSWAVPKGPSTDPRVKRLAVPTEDHPMEYIDFEGNIPEGQYGGGIVMVWDTGKFRNLKEGSLEEWYKKGHLEFWLEGKKLRGGYALFKINKNWLLVKMKDNEADARRNPVSTEPRSVLSGRTLKEIEKKEE